MDQVDNSKLEQRIGYSFMNKSLLAEALTHKSYGVEHKITFNERLEFLGDSVLSLIVSEFLYSKYYYSEGRLSKVRSYIISSDFFSQLARNISLGDYILLGRGEVRSNGHDKTRVLCNCYEALFGALYLDSSYDVVRAIFLELNEHAIIQIIEQGLGQYDTKNILQSYALREYKLLPDYVLKGCYGFNHTITYIVLVYINSEFLGKGLGGSIKVAEKSAAAAAISKLGIRLD